MPAGNFNHGNRTVTSAHFLPSEKISRGRLPAPLAMKITPHQLECVCRKMLFLGAPAELWMPLVTLYTPED